MGEEKAELRVLPANSQERQRFNHNTDHVADARLTAKSSTAAAPRGPGGTPDPLHAQPHQRDSGMGLLNLLQMLTVGFHQDPPQGDCGSGANAGEDGNRPLACKAEQ